MKNHTNNFEFQVSSMTDSSSTLNYTWYNTGWTATITQSSSVQAGAVILTVRDANGAVVYTSAMSQTGTFVTVSGAPGNWQILVMSVNASGNLDFRVQRGT